MKRGFDTTANCGPVAATIKQANYDFVARYYAHRGAKRLTQSEAQALSVAGVELVAVWEDAPTHTGYFSRARGVDDGTSAYHAAMLIGQPAGSAIYFAVDFDASQMAISGAITDYFRGVADGFDTMSANMAALYKVGVYGSGATCSWLLNHGLAKYSWLAQSTGWAGYQSFTRWNIKQGKETQELGMDIDGDVATDDAGGFLVAAIVPGVRPR
jgi:hypothetical protein